MHESIYYCFFFFMSQKYLQLANCISLIAGFFCKYWKCVFQKFSVLSISIPNNLTDDSMVNSTPFIFNTDLLRSFLELIIIDWNLFGFTIMLFVLNQFIAVSHSFVKFLKVLSNLYCPHILCCHLQNLQVQLL